MIEQYSGNYSKMHLFIYRIDVMLDLAQNYPLKVKIPTLTIRVDQKYDPPNKNSSILYSGVYYKYQQRSLQR